MRIVALSFAAALLAVPATAQTLPDGNWSLTCRDAGLSDGTLFARCKTRDGAWRDTYLDAGRCGWVENSNGRLTCVEDMTAGDLPKRPRDEDDGARIRGS